MPPRQLLNVLDEIPDSGEIVILAPPRQETDGLLLAWRAAHLEADGALAEWRLRRTRGTFASFRAAEDRADAAQDALALRRTW